MLKGKRKTNYATNPVPGRWVLAAPGQPLDRLSTGYEVTPVV
jgi:hypothetical protein